MQNRCRVDKPTSVPKKHKTERKEKKSATAFFTPWQHFSAPISHFVILSFRSFEMWFERLHNFASSCTHNRFSSWRPLTSLLFVICFHCFTFLSLQLPLKTCFKWQKIVSNCLCRNWNCKWNSELFGFVVFGVNDTGNILRLVFFSGVGGWRTEQWNWFMGCSACFSSSAKQPWLENAECGARRLAQSEWFDIKNCLQMFQHKE